MNGGGDKSRAALELVLQARSDRFDAADDRWQAQVNDFLRDLDREVDGLRREIVAQPGTKGGTESIILALGTAGAFSASIEFVKAWLGRDRTRSLEISYTTDGQQQRVTVRGDALSDEAIAAVGAAAAAHLGLAQ